MVVQVVGLGTVGLPTALHYKDYYSVVGYDTNPKQRERAESNGVATVDELQQADVHVICTPTHTVFDVANQLKQHSNPLTLTLVESTVQLGTTRLIHRRNGGYTAACPHRYWSEDPEGYGVVQPRVLGAADDKSLSKAAFFYLKCNIPIVQVTLSP